MPAPKLSFSLFFLVTTVAAAPLSAQSTGDDEAAARSDLTLRVQNFFGNLKDPSVNPEAAFNDLLADSPLIDRPEQLGAFVDNYQKLEESSFGKFPGCQTGSRETSWRGLGVSNVFIRDRAISDCLANCFLSPNKRVRRTC